MRQARARRWAGLRRFPPVTAAVFAVTAVTSVLGLVSPQVLAALQRTPEGLHGDWWRSLTSLLVQDGGVLGTASNLLFLLLLGVLAERLAGPGWWLVAYLGAGLAGELAGYAWQPRGAGSSVANCGLAGLLVVALAAGTRPPRPAPMAVLWWCGALASTRWGPGPLLAAVAGAAAVQLAPPGRAPAAGRLVAVAAAATAAALLAAADVHGAALAAGIVLAAVIWPAWGRAATG
jgi:membrane associated rhomboid family serine protease